MKTEISRDSHQPTKRYSGVYQQQGRMLTDADWNEGVDILKARLNEALKDVVGNKAGRVGGTPRHRALKVIKALAIDDLTLQPGHVHVDGVMAQVPGDADIAYDAQPDFPGAPGLPESPSDHYSLYADLWERTVTHVMDERLRDRGLHGADTCTRKQTMAQVKWCPTGVDPEQSVKNPAKGDAQLSVTLLQKSTQPDPCDPCADQIEVDSKVGNYLFRVEVHDVKGAANLPSEITLKWSSENAAEHYALTNGTGKKVEPPDKFKTGPWAYEFFDETSERHLGVHLAPGFTPARDALTEGYPETDPTRSFVRRWDGFCRLAKKAGGWQVTEAFDRSQPGPVSFAEIASGKLTVNLDALTLQLKLNHSFVAGDYWVAEVREAEDKAGSKLIVNETPHGIEHHYLTLGTVEGGVLRPNPEADRKYAFPPLTEMTHLFMAGGDGQEVMPGQPLPQPVRVGVANGEWAVEGATVRFEIESGGGSLSPAAGIKTDADGIAECHWTPGSALGADCRVKATLVDPDHAGDASKDMDPPVYFYANLITADQVAYAPACPASGQNAVHSHLATDAAVSLNLGADGYYTVKEVLDALLCHLRAKHIPYDPTNVTRWADVNEEEGAAPPDTVQQAIDALLENLHSEDIKYPLPDCSPDTNTFKSYIAAHIANIVNEGGTQYTRINDLWDALLCHLDAAKLPLDKSDTGLCSDFSAANTVQDALKILCDRPTGGGCKVTVGDRGEFPNIEEAIQALMERDNLPLTTFNLCLLPGEHALPPQAFFNTLNSKLNRQFSLLLCGSGRECTFLIVKEPKTLLEMHTFYSKNLTVVSGDEGMSLTLRCEQINFTHIHFDAFIRDAENIPLILDGREQVHVTDCIIMAHHNKSFDMPQTVFGEFNILADLFSNEVVLIRTHFLSQTWERSMFLASPDQAGARREIAKNVSDAIKEGTSALTAEETESYDRLVTSLTVKETDSDETGSDVALLTRRLAGDLDRIRFATASAVTSHGPAGAENGQVTAVMMPSARADCLFDHNDIIGRFSLYGTPPQQPLEPKQMQTMHETLIPVIQSGKIRFTSTRRALQLRNNHLTQLLVAERVIEELRGFGEGGGDGVLSGIFESMLLSDNVFRAANSFFVARGHSFTATRFDQDSEGDASPPAGIVFGDNAVYVGTVGKSESVDPGDNHMFADIKLYDTTRNPRASIATESATFRLEIVRSMPQ